MNKNREVEEFSKRIIQCEKKFRVSFSDKQKCVYTNTQTEGKKGVIPSSALTRKYFDDSPIIGLPLNSDAIC